MGAESSSLQNCQLDEALQVSSEKEWQIHPGRTGDGSAVSVFVYKNAVQNKDLIENAAKNLKILRHPFIVKFLGWTKSSDGHRLITEPVTPLELQLDLLSSIEICSGLHDIAQALSFLHDRGGYCHNNVSISTIFVSEDGSWKLGCMEHVCRYEDVTMEKLKKFASLRDSKTIAPEEGDGKLGSEKSTCFARDAYAFGIVVEQLEEYIGNVGGEVEWFHGRVHEELLQEDPTLRPKLSSLLTDPIFQNDFLSILNFLKNITVKTEAEKTMFFGNVVQKLHNLPAELVARRLTRLLLSRFVLLDLTADRDLIPHFLHPCDGKRHYDVNNISPILPKGLFQKFVIPELFKIFHVRDCHVRLVILKHFSAYVTLFDKSTLQNVILPQVIIGLRDTHDALVSASLHALAEMVPILGSEVVIGSNRHSIFKEGKPKFKTMNGSAVNHMDRYLEPTPVIDAVSQVVYNSEPAPSLKVATKTLKEQAKEAERQKRKEEAKKRMEERRKQREEKKIEKERDNDSSDTVSQNSLSPRHQHPITGKKGDGDADIDVSKNWNGQNIENFEIENSQHEVDRSQHDIENSVSHENSDEDYIDKEIESEIMSMDSTLSPKEMSRISALNDMPVVDSSLNVTVDWSDVGDSKQENTKREVSGKGILKLKSSLVDRLKEEEVENSQVQPEDSWDKDDQTWGDDDWGSIEPSPKHKQASINKANSHVESPTVVNSAAWNQLSRDNDSAKPASENQSGKFSPRKTKSPNTRTKAGASKPHKHADLGSEFDVKSISIKKTKGSVSSEDTLDFFADMEPVIKTSSMTDKTNVSNEKEEKSKLTFDVITDDNSEAAGGWGDDLEWGEDDNWS